MEQYGIVALGIDDELFLDFVDEQPGAYIRRHRGRKLTDEELYAHYLGLLKSADPNKRTGYFRHNVCLALPSGEVYHASFEERIKFLGNPPERGIKDYPIGSLIGERNLEELRKVVREFVGRHL